MDLISRAVVAPALVADWLPALDGVAARLAAGAAVADVGCGYGAPGHRHGPGVPGVGRFTGFDVDDASVARARKAALAAGVADRVSFEVAAAADVPGGPYDLVTFIDSLHDLGDPAGALRRIRQVLTDDGVVLLVEHAGSDRLEENLSPAGRFFYAASALVCVPNALAERRPRQPARGDTGRAGAAAGGGRGRVLPGAPGRGRRAAEPSARAAPLTRPGGADNVGVSGPAPLVGRGPALAALRAALDGALAGHGSLVLISRRAGHREDRPGRALRRPGGRPRGAGGVGQLRRGRRGPRVLAVDTGAAGHRRPGRRRGSRRPAGHGSRWRGRRGGRPVPVFDRVISQLRETAAGQRPGGGAR